MTIRLASVSDSFQISKLYHDIYEGTYPDPMMRNFTLIENFIKSTDHFWFVADENGQLVSSVLYLYNSQHKLAKVFAGVVRSEYRGNHLMEQMMIFGIEYIRRKAGPVELCYATTRTVHEGAQNLTEKLGYKKLGIFPNVHKTLNYETHCLTALYDKTAFQARHTQYQIHHKVKPLVDIASAELGIDSITSVVPERPTRVLLEPSCLEYVDAPAFVQYRYESLKKSGGMSFEFFPFNLPNVMILSPDQTIEMFMSVSNTDGHCLIVGGRVSGDTSYTALFRKMCDILRDRGVRYIEMLVRADKPKILESILGAKFIPCAFLPAYLLENQKRYDYLILSRTFEIFDFQNIKLRGINQRYLEEYYKTWKSIALTPKMIND